LKGIIAVQNETELPKSAQYSFVVFVFTWLITIFFFKYDSIQKTFLRLDLLQMACLPDCLGKMPHGIVKDATSWILSYEYNVNF